MARRDADDFVNEVRDNLAGETTETITATRILRWVNDAYTEICSIYRFDQLKTKETLTTSSGTAEYTCSNADYLDIDIVIDDTNNAEVRSISNYEYQRYVQGNAASITGVPAFFVVSGGTSAGKWKLTFYPTPTGTYSIDVHYYKLPDLLVQSPAATGTIIPNQWDDAIICRATAKGWRMLGDMGKYAAWMGAAKQMERDALRFSFRNTSVGARPGSIVGNTSR